MSLLKTLIVGTVAVILFATAPGARAQSQNDLELMQTFLSIMSDYIEVIDATHEISSDAEKAAIMQMQKIQEVYEQRGNKAESVGILRAVLKDSKNLAIRNAAYIMLGDTLKETGRADEAIDTLRQGLEENIQAAQ